MTSPTPAPGPATEIPAIPPGVRLTTLDNGLTIIVREDHCAPVVSAQAWCRTGSIDEGKWLGGGLSHVLEHMLFKGTSTRAGGRIDQEVQDAGGYMNAYTSFDRTVYWINVPNTGARVAIDILCDIMQNATLPADEMVKEKEVILREMDMNQDDPSRRSSRRLFETAFTRSPYRFTIIGYPDIYNRLDRSDVFDYYRERYVANNMFFVVVGDVVFDEVVSQIRQAFANSKTRPILPIHVAPEPRQTAPRELIEEATIEIGHVHLSWHIPPLRHPDTPALDVLATLLGNGRSSRLFREIRERQALVTSIDAWTYSPGETGLFGISALVEPEKFEAARSGILQELERLKTDLVPPDELAKVIKQFVAATLATRKTMQGQAQDLGGNWIGSNDLNFSERYLAAVKVVRPPDLQRVTREYLTHENRTLYALLPEGTAPQFSYSETVLAEHAIQKFELPNGLRLLVKEDHRLPFVEARMVFRGGVLSENEKNNGVTALMAKMLLQGTKKRSAEEIACEIESVGGSIDTFSGNNSFGLNLELLSADCELGLDLLADVALHPGFPLEDFQREQEMQLSHIRSQRDQLLQSGARAMRRAMFGPIGYGLDAMGSEESVGRLTLEEVARHYARLARPDNCVLAIFGDVDAMAIRAEVEEHFGQWNGNGQNSALELPKPEPLLEAKRVCETRDKKQLVLLVGFPGTTLFHRDRYALELVQEACSDLGSRLFMRIRDELGLAYYVGAQQFPGLTPGYFSFYVGTAPDKLLQVERELLQEAAALRDHGLTEAELKRGKAKVIGQKKIARQDLGGLATTMALDELYGLGYMHNETEDAKFEAVTVEEIREVARKYLSAKAFVISIVKPEES